jgi:hypothetical protein
MPVPPGSRRVFVPALGARWLLPRRRPSSAAWTPTQATTRAGASALPEPSRPRRAGPPFGPVPGFPLWHPLAKPGPCGARLAPSGPFPASCHGELLALGAPPLANPGGPRAPVRARSCPVGHAAGCSPVVACRAGGTSRAKPGGPRAPDGARPAPSGPLPTAAPSWLVAQFPASLRCTVGAGAAPAREHLLGTVRVPFFHLFARVDAQFLRGHSRPVPSGPLPSSGGGLITAPTGRKRPNNQQPGQAPANTPRHSGPGDNDGPPGGTPMHHPTSTPTPPAAGVRPEEVGRECPRRTCASTWANKGKQGARTSPRRCSRPGPATRNRASPARGARSPRLRPGGAPSASSPPPGRKPGTQLRGHPGSPRGRGPTGQEARAQPQGQDEPRRGAGNCASNRQRTVGRQRRPGGTPEAEGARGTARATTAAPHTAKQARGHPGSRGGRGVPQAPPGRCRPREQPRQGSAVPGRPRTPAESLMP